MLLLADITKVQDAVIDTDWPALKVRFNTYLALTNYDSNSKKLGGYQIFETPYPPVSDHKKLRSIAHQIPKIAIPNEQGTTTIFR